MEIVLLDALLPTCCRTFRATGITTYLQNGGTLEHVQTIANHEFHSIEIKRPRTGSTGHLIYRFARGALGVFKLALAAALFAEIAAVE